MTAFENLLPLKIAAGQATSPLRFAVHPVRKRRLHYVMQLLALIASCAGRSETMFWFGAGTGGGTARPGGTGSGREPSERERAQDTLAQQLEQIEWLASYFFLSVLSFILLYSIAEFWRRDYAFNVLVSVREHIESCESFVIQEWWPDSRRVTRCGRQRTAHATTAADYATRVT
jgi:hypothetical protein